MRIMFADEARFGRINRPRPCWAPIGIRPAVASQLIREYIYLYGAVSPKDGTCVYLIMPTSNTACFQAFLISRRENLPGRISYLVLDGAPNHRCGDLVLPDNISLLFLPLPELNLKENLWDEIREKIFKNYALKSGETAIARTAPRCDSGGRDGAYVVLQRIGARTHLGRAAWYPDLWLRWSSPHSPT